ncbi:hypothetical protein [Alishewanella phage vB_AspM_Slicko01]|nr:hypothetical protein [Alishewanella phage vB_AspM_Slicko01]
MNTTNLLDKAIEELNGVLSQKHNKLMRDSAGNRIFEIADGQLIKFSSVTFETRAKELGWINGYKYGVEYPTKGEKPDLPDDLKICISYGNGYSCIIMSGLVSTWENTTIFRIVDALYKPVSETPESKQNAQDVSDNSWHERGEPPPVGALFEYAVDRHSYITSLIHERSGIVWLAGIGLVIFNPKHFKPIKSEREKFIDAAYKAAYFTTSCKVSLGKLYDAGFSAPSIE